MSTQPEPVYIELPGYEWYAAEDFGYFSPINHDFRWNDDETMFRPITLLWWDDASYIRYQSGDLHDDPSEDYQQFDPFPPTLRSATYKPIEDEDEEDNIPF